ncbi:MAG: hypothetical protein WC521_05785 [Bdellovibrionales bacterium]
MDKKKTGRKIGVGDSDLTVIEAAHGRRIPSLHKIPTPIKTAEEGYGRGTFTKDASEQEKNERITAELRGKKQDGRVTVVPEPDGDAARKNLKKLPNSDIILAS